MPEPRPHLVKRKRPRLKGSLWARVLSKRVQRSDDFPHRTAGAHRRVQGRKAKLASGGRIAKEPTEAAAANAAGEVLRELKKKRPAA